MKYVILLFVCFSIQFIAAQDQDAATYEKILATFQENYNAQNTDAIFDLYAPELQEEMTKEGVIGFVKGCFERFGNLNSMTAMQIEEGVHNYKAVFQKSNLEVQLQINKDGKISTIQFHPIQGEVRE